MRILIIGGTRFIGPRVVKQLLAGDHWITLFHRGQTEADLPASVTHVYGERRDLASFKSQFSDLAFDLVIDMICYDEREAYGLLEAVEGIVSRVVVISSMDVYRAYGCLLGLESGPREGSPLTEDSPLRSSRFPYRQNAKSPDDMAFDYDKIPVENVVMNAAGLRGTVLRLPAVYGPGDHRVFEYLKRMEDGRHAILLQDDHARWRWTRGYVDDVADAIALASVNDRAAGRIYNVGETDAMPEAEWVRSIGRAAGWAGNVVVLPREEMPPHLRTAYDFSHDLLADTSRIREELGYADRSTRDVAIKRTVEWERAHAPQQVDFNRFNYDAEDAALGN